MLEKEVDESYSNYFGRLVGYARDISRVVYPPLFIFGVYDVFTGPANKDNADYLKIAVGAYVLNKVLKVVTWFWDSEDVFAQKNKQCLLGEDIGNKNVVGAQNLSHPPSHFLAQQQYTAQIQSKKPFKDLKKRYRYLESKPASFCNGVISLPNTESDWKNVESVVDSEYKKIVEKNNGNSGCE